MSDSPGVGDQYSGELSLLRDCAMEVLGAAVEDVVVTGGTAGDVTYAHLLTCTLCSFVFKLFKCVNFFATLSCTVLYSM